MYSLEPLVMPGERASLILLTHDPELDALQLAVGQEGAEAAGHAVVRHESQVVLVELKRQRELTLDLQVK